MVPYIKAKKAAKRKLSNDADDHHNEPFPSTSQPSQMIPHIERYFADQQSKQNLHDFARWHTLGSRSTLSKYVANRINDANPSVKQAKKRHRSLPEVKIAERERERLQRSEPKTHEIRQEKESIQRSKPAVKKPDMSEKKYRGGNDHKS